MNVPPEAIKYGRSLSDESIAADKKIIRDNNVEIISLSEADLDILKEKAEPVYRDIRAKVGDELVDLFLSEIDKARNM